MQKTDTEISTLNTQFGCYYNMALQIVTFNSSSSNVMWRQPQ